MCLNRQERETRKKISLWIDQFAHLWESLIQGVAMAVVPNTQWWRGAQSLERTQDPPHPKPDLEHSYFWKLQKKHFREIETSLKGAGGESKRNLKS